MAFCQVQWSSAVLRKQVTMNVILPEQGQPPYPVYYLLHGLSDDYSIWQRRTRIEWYVRELPLIVVMPGGFRGFYTNNAEGPAYASYLAEELPTFVEQHFAAASSREARCIGGLSMGGYGALRIALGYPARYASANSHSGALLYGHSREGAGADSCELRRIFGQAPEGTDHDLVELARRAQTAGVAPQMRIDCGTEDGLLDHNRVFHAELTSLGIPHTYEEFPGGHSWDYWDTHVREALRFHCRALGLPGTVAG